MQEILQTGTTSPLFTDEMITYINQNNQNQLNADNFRNIFKQAFNLAYAKFTKHISQHNALPLFKSIQCFNPKFTRDSNSRHNLLDYSKIFEFKNPSNQLINEWNTYCQMEEDLQIELNLINIGKTNRKFCLFFLKLL